MSKEKCIEPNIFPHPVTTTNKLALKKNPNRKSILIYNNGTDTVYVNSQPLGTIATGIPIPVGVEYDSETNQGDIYLIAASGTQDCRIEEDSE